VAAGNAKRLSAGKKPEVNAAGGSNQ
jgi:hypothetical protein